MNIAEAAKQNDHRKLLIALRAKLAVTLDNCESGRDIAALSKRIVEVDAELAAMPDPDKAKNPVQLAREKARERGA